MKILSMSSFVPEQICDTVRFTQYSGERNISHYCGYASDFVSEVMRDESIDGAVYPKSCDSTRIITSYLAGSGKFHYQFHVPSYGISGAEDYFADSIRSYKEAVENYYSISINDIYQRTEKVNLRNQAIRRIYDEISSFSYAAYLEFIHQMLKLPLAEQIWDKNIESRMATGKNVFIVGSFLSNTKIARMIEDVGLTVVGDTLPESGRLISAQPVELSGNIYKKIVSSMLSMRLSPTQNSFKTILAEDFQEMKKKSVKGVIFITQKYCEAYDYLYALYKGALDALEIPVLKITVNDTEDTRKAALALEAFADTI